MRIEGPEGQRWTVGRRWLPWRPRAHELHWVSGEAAVAAIALIVAEWAAFVVLLPLVLPLRFMLSRWVVVAYGTHPDGTELRCERRAERGGVAALQAAVVEEIRSGGAPRSPGEPIVLSSPNPGPVLVNGVELDLAKVTAPVTFDAVVSGLAGPDARADWTAGVLVVNGTRLAFHPDGPDGVVWPVPPATAVTLRPAADGDGPLVAGLLVADHRTHTGRPIRIAVAPQLGVVLQAALSSSQDAGPAPDQAQGHPLSGRGPGGSPQPGRER